MAGFLREHTALSKRLLSSKNEASSKCRRAACSKADFIVGGVDVRQEQEAKSRSLLRRDDTRSPRCHGGLLVSLADGLYSLAYANTASSGSHCHAAANSHSPGSCRRSASPARPD